MIKIKIGYDTYGEKIITDRIYEVIIFELSDISSGLESSIKVNKNKQVIKMKLDEISNFRFGVCKNKPHEKCKDCDSSYEFVIQCLFEGD